MQVNQGGWVHSIGGNRHFALSGSVPYIIVLFVVAATLSQAGCAGLVSGTTSNALPTTLSISNVQVFSTTTSGAQILWTTNVAADSSVDFGTAASYGSTTPVDLTMVTSHQVTLSGLAAGTTYYFQVTSTDSKNNQSHSGGYKFKTAGLSISGTISPTNGGSGATVTLSGVTNSTTTANSSGAFTFTGLASGSYTITPSSTSYTFTPASQNVSLSTTNVTGVNFTASATLTAPTIATQPVSQTVTAGQTATFTVTATGTTPLAYQWQKNGANISGATASSYTTPATTTSDSGSTFDVIVSNSAGTATSTAASLTVIASAINVSPNPMSFGSDVVGTMISQALVIKNAGTATLSISQINESGAAFSVSGFTLPLNVNAGQQTSITVAFAPTSVGTASGSISIVSNDPTSPTSVGLSGSGVAATLTLGISPTSLNFGNVNVGSSSSQNVTVTNTGNSNVTISGVTTLGAGFSASGVSANTTLAPSQSATLSVSFAPTAAGSVTGNVSVVSTATNSPAIVSLSGSGVASTSSLPTCGKLNDTNIYLPPNYDTFVPPAKGGSYTDPVFGCTITRITDAVAMGWASANHFYSTVTPFNANDRYLFLFSGYTGGSPIIVDLSGNTIVPASNMPTSNSAIEAWDTMNPNVFYYTSGNQFIKGTITGVPPNATVTPTVLATFSQYGSVVIPGDMDLSNDDLHIWLTSAGDMGGYSYIADVFLVTLNAGNGAATSASEGAVLSGITYHKLQIVPNNGVSIEGPNPRTIYNTDGSVYEVPGGGTSNHTDWGLDSSGKMVAAALFFDGTAQNGCPSNWGYGLLDLASNSVRLCLNDGIQNVGNASHNSARDTTAGHWIVFSDDDSGSCPSSSYWCFNNPTNMAGWSLYTGEILIWDDLGNTVRLAHHRSRSDENYWAQTRASISRSGKYIVFDSNYNQSATSGGANYTDVYVIGPLY